MSSFLIIGASRGLGLEFVKQLVADKAVDCVYATVRDPKRAEDLQKLASSHKGRIVVLTLDMNDEASIKSAAFELKTDLTKRGQSLSMVLVNAGILNGQGDILKLSAADMEEGLKTNLVGPLLCGQAFAPLLLESKAPKRQLVFMSSLVGSIAMLPVVSKRLSAAMKSSFYPVGIYAVTKSALNMLARQFALRLEPEGVNVVLLHPGLVDTEMNATLPPEALVSKENSIKGMLSALNNVELGQCAGGILTNEGKIEPW